MGYPRDLLSDGEEIAFEIRPHWRALLIPGLVLVGVLVGLGFLLSKWGSWFADAEFFQNLGQWGLIAAGLFILVVFVVRPLLFWFTTLFVFTNRRIIIRSGLVARKGADMPLSKVNNVSFSISMGGRILNYGTLEIDSASDDSLVIHDVPNVEDIQREINRLHEEDDEYRRRRG